MYNIGDQGAAAKQGFIALAIIWVAVARALDVNYYFSLAEGYMTGRTFIFLAVLTGVPEKCDRKIYFWAYMVTI